MSNYNQKSFEACLFNPLIEGNIFIAFPVLHEIVGETWSGDPMMERLVRYIIMVYDPRSILVAMERDLNYRKGVAAELSGLPLDDIATMESIYTCTHMGLVDMICKFLVRFIRSKEWAAICAYEYKFWEAIRLIMQPISAEMSDKVQLDAATKKDVLSASVDEGLTKLDLYYKTFFGEDTDLERRAKKRMTPELMAKKEA